MSSDLRKNNSGNTILLTILILTGVLLVSLTASTLVTRGINLGSRQFQSAKAYFAAEAGLEKTLYYLSNGDFDDSGCPSGLDECLVDIKTSTTTLTCVPSANCRDTSGTYFDLAKQDLGNGAYYVIKYSSTTSETLFTSTGVYLETRRKVEAAYPR